MAGASTPAAATPEVPAETSAVPAGSPRPGWQARLQLQFERVGMSTRLVRRRHRGPLLVQRAFYPEPDPRRAAGAAAAADGAPGNAAGSEAAEPCHVYLLHPPGGVVGGDQLQLDVAVRPGAHALLTTPAAGKFYRRGGALASRLTQSLQVEGLLEWLPQENIFYPECVAGLCTAAHLRGAGRFIGWEIGCLGLPASGQTLGDGHVRQALELWRDGRPVLLERVHIEQACLAAAWGLSGHAALGTWLACPAPPEALTLARALTSERNCADITIACTLIDGALSCRGYAMRADRLKQVFIELWAALRPILLGRAATPPRIWST